MNKRPEGTNPDGSPRFHFELTQEEHDAGFVAYWPGPISGTIVVEGTSYDVSDTIIPVKKEHVGPLHLAIHQAHHAAGRMLEAPLPELPDVSVT